MGEAKKFHDGDGSDEVYQCVNQGNIEKLRPVGEKPHNGNEQQRFCSEQIHR